IVSATPGANLLGLEHFCFCIVGYLDVRVTPCTCGVASSLSNIFIVTIQVIDLTEHTRINSMIVHYPSNFQGCSHFHSYTAFSFFSLSSLHFSPFAITSKITKSSAIQRTAHIVYSPPSPIAFCIAGSDRHYLDSGVNVVYLEW